MGKCSWYKIFLLGTLLVSCTDRDLYTPDNSDPAENLDLTFKFEMKSEKDISIQAVTAEGDAAAGALFGVYFQPPYTGDGFRGTVDPAYIGYTDDNGHLNARIALPANVSKLYVVPLTAGLGAMQEADAQGTVSLRFQGVPFQFSSPVACLNEKIVDDLTFTRVSNLYDLQVPFATSEIGNDGIPLLGASPLVSKETVSPQLVTQINSWYPEQQNVVKEDLGKNPDLVVTADEGAEVWVTYIGDGGFSESNPRSWNLLAYYNYREGAIQGRTDLDHLRMTLLLPNTHQEKCPQGLKVQLLYWDGTSYNTVFPKGTRIGFALAREGFANNGQPITEKGAYTFKNRAYPTATGDPSGFYYSTPALNETRTTQAVIRLNLDNNCCIVGFDMRRSDDPKSDFDFNDVLVKVTSSPVLALTPEEEIPPVEEVTPSESVHGTLAFEDQWPKEGDYDFNDFVVDYTYRLIKNEQNKVTGIKLIFTPVAKGAASYTQIGFGIELPVRADLVDGSKLDGTTLEEGNTLATFIVWDSVNRLLGNGAGFINTEKGHEKVAYAPVEVDIPLKAPADQLAVLQFNPFIYVNDRSHEIHLVDHHPTSKMDLSLFGTENDLSDTGKGIYFRMDNYYPWVLDFPRLSANSPTWKYPKERANIADTYLNYKQWILNKTDLSWFDPSIKGNVNQENLY